MAFQPPLARLPFLQDPTAIWEKCMELLDNWSSTKAEYAAEMKSFREKMVVKTLCVTNVLEDTLPENITVPDAEEHLTKAYENKSPSKASMAKKSKPGCLQLVQHLNAYMALCAEDFPDLSEDLVKRTHGIMMQGLVNEDGLSVNAGHYRTISVKAGKHVFPPFESIPDSMARIVQEYNKKFSSSHDPFQLASWLYFKVVSLHPFVDGNGRISRLLWCYSLMRDGLPFPPVLTSGHKKSQKHLVMCLTRDRERLLMNDNPHMTTLTVSSVLQGWKHFSKHCPTSVNVLLGLGTELE